MNHISLYGIDELKTIYRILHENIVQNPDLMDSHLLHDLQSHLQQQATRDGVDISDHAQWANWLNNGVTLTVI